MFKVIRGIEINDTVLTNTTVPEAVVTAWSSGTTYGIGDRAGSAIVNGAAQSVYESLQTGNLNNALNDTDFWKLIGVVYPAYSAGVTYALNDIVSDLVNHRLYKSLAAGNLGNALTDATKWQNISATNAYKMFDPVVQDQTTLVDGFEVIVSSSSVFVTGIGFLNVDAATIEIEIVSGVTTVFSETYDMNEPPLQSGFWWWLFDPIQRKTSLFVDNLPSILNTDITVTFTGSGDVSCGIMSIGESLSIGETVYGVNYSIISYSQTVEDASGRITISKGSYRDVADVPVVIYNAQFNAVRNLLNENRDTPNVWLVDENYPILYGFYDRYDLMLSNAAFSELTIRIEGLI